MATAMLTEVQAVEGAQLTSAAPSHAVSRLAAYMFRQASPRVDARFSALPYDVVEVTLSGWQRYEASVNGSRGRAAQFVAGDATVYPSGSEVCLKGKCDADVVLLVLDPVILRGAANGNGASSRALEPLQALRSHALVRLALQAVHSERALELHGAGYAEALELELCAALLPPSRATNARGGVPSRLAPWTLHKVLQHMRDNLDGDCSLATLAALAGLSKFHFVRCFRGTTGQSPHRTLLEMRLAEARQQLSRSTIDLSALGSQLGFASQSHFTSAFRKCTGTSPGQYRQLFRRSYFL